MSTQRASHLTLLLDADIIAYPLAATAQRSYKFPGMDTPALALDDWEGQPERIDTEVSKLCKKLKTTNVIVCLSCPTSDNFRLDVLPTYKGNRASTVRPEYLAQVKQYLEDNYPSYRRDRLEADDIMGILSTHPSLVKGKKVIVSEDKDMQTIPGLLFNPNKDTTVRSIARIQADRYHMYQTLIGDPTDGYTGIPRCGPKKGEAVMQAADEEGSLWATDDQMLAIRWRRVVEAYASKGLSEEDALVQARVARILRATDYDFQKKEPILWNPPQ